MEPQIYITRTIQSQMSSHLSQALQNIEEHTILIPLLHMLSFAAQILPLAVHKLTVMVYDLVTPGTMQDLLGELNWSSD